MVTQRMSSYVLIYERTSKRRKVFSDVILYTREKRWPRQVHKDTPWVSVVEVVCIHRYIFHKIMWLVILL